MSATFLTKDEVAELTGLKSKRRQAEQLRKMGLPFWINAAEAPIVPRSAIEGKVTPSLPKPKAQWIPPGMRPESK
jgi:hypothetical protein